MIKYISCVSLSLATACTYSANTEIAPSYNVYSNYNDRVPGRYALYVETERMTSEVTVSGLNCSAYTYTVDANSPFAVSVSKTLAQLFEEIEMVTEPLNRNDLAAQGFDALVFVSVDDMDVDLKVIPGFWSAKMEADAEIVANYRVDGPTGRLLGGSVEGDDEFEADAGAACEGGGDAVGGAVEAAMKDLTRQLGERLSNSTRLRGDANS